MREKYSMLLTWLSILFGFTMLMFVLFRDVPKVQAQVPPTTLTFHPILDHTHCSLAQTPQPDGKGPGACIATDGFWLQGPTDTAPWQVQKPLNGTAITVNNKLPDAGGNISLKISDFPGTLLPTQDMTTRTCPVLSFVTGSTDTIKLGTCGN